CTSWTAVAPSSRASPARSVRTRRSSRSTSESGTDMVLRIEDVHIQYGAAVRAVQGCSLDVAEGELVSLIGQNGAGKSTLVKAVMGQVPVAGGTITVDGASVGSRGYSSVQAGVAHVPEDRGIFASLSVGENLRLGAVTRKDKRAVAEDLE